MKTVETLITGSTYNVANLKFQGWNDGQDHEGYEFTHYFTLEGKYKGLDQHGIEPLFEIEWEEYKPKPKGKFYLHQTYSHEIPAEGDKPPKTMWLKAKVPVNSEEPPQFSADGHMNVINDTNKTMVLQNGRIVKPGEIIGPRQFSYAVAGASLEEAFANLQSAHEAAEAAEQAKHEAEIAAVVKKAESQEAMQRIVVPTEAGKMPLPDHLRKPFNPYIKH